MSRAQSDLFEPAVGLIRGRPSLVQARFALPAIVEASTTEYEWVIARHRTKAARETAGDAR